MMDGRWEMKDERDGFGGAKEEEIPKDMSEMKMTTNRRSTNLSIRLAVCTYSTCSRQRAGDTHLHPGFSKGSLVQGPELVSTCYSMYVQRSTYIRSRYLASRIEEPLLFISLLLVYNKCVPNTCDYMDHIHFLQIYVYSYKSNGQVPPCATVQYEIHPYFLLLWVGHLQPQNALLGRMDAPTHA